MNELTLTHTHRRLKIISLKRFLITFEVYPVDGEWLSKCIHVNIQRQMNLNESGLSQDDWEHSSNDSTGSRPSSGSRSGSRGRNNQFRAPAKVTLYVYIDVIRNIYSTFLNFTMCVFLEWNKDCSFDVLGTDIWAANLDCHGWDSHTYF